MVKSKTIKKCDKAKKLIIMGVVLISVPGLFTVGELILNFPTIYDEMSMFIDKQKNIFELNQYTKQFIVLIFLVILGLLLGLIGWVKYKKWNCRDYVDIREV